MSSSFMQQLQPTRVNLVITNLCNRKCPFCYINGWATTIENNALHLSSKNLKTIIKWLKSSRINKVKLTGGEPMLHPNVIGVIRELVQNRIEVDAILTNGLGETDLYQKVIEIARNDWLVNVTSPETYTKIEWERLNKNLEVFRWKNEDATTRISGFDTDSLRRLCLSITFYRPDQEYRYIIELAKKFGVPVIRYDISRPSTNKSNVHVDYDSLPKFKPILMDFVRSCIREEIKPGLDDVLPYCIFTQKELKLLHLFGVLPPICVPVLDVMPDLTVEYCMPMRGILTEKIHNMTVNQIFEKQLMTSDTLRTIKLPSCDKCYNWDNNLCQGYCLRYKCDLLGLGSK